MRKISLFMLGGLVLISVCGCGKANKFVDKLDLDQYDLQCDEIKNTKDIYYDGGNNYFITKSGDIYQFDSGALFSSNDKNCQKIDTEVKAKKFIQNYSDIYVLGEDDEFYVLSNGNINIADDSNIKLLKLEKNVRSSFFKAGDNHYYYKDKNIYAVDDELSNYVLTDKVVLSLKDDEEIDYIIDDTIKTTKRYYVYKTFITNEEECQKYTDIECIEESGFYELDEDVEEMLGDVLFYKQKIDTIIDKNGTLYTKAYRGG